MNGQPTGHLGDDEYRQLLELRDAIRRFLQWSERRAREVGLTPAQHQLLLAIRGHVGGAPTVGDVAGHLLLRHHSVVELVDRAEAAGLVERVEHPDDRRSVQLRLTADGSRRLAGLAAVHLEELHRLGLASVPLASGLESP